MFERFTRDARATVMGAVGESERRGDRHIGTEHLVLGVLASANPLTCAALDDTAATLEDARRMLDEFDAAALAALGVEIAEPPLPRPDDGWRRSPGRFRRGRDHRPFTDGAKRTLEHALREALAIGDRHIGTEHVLLALCDRSGEDPAHRLLTALHVDPSVIADEVRRRVDAAA